MTMAMAMEHKPVGEMLEAVPRQPKIKRSQYQANGRFPIVDQSQTDIAGYTDDESELYQGDLPVVIFGDHTRVLKFVDFPFCVGADGTQLLRPVEGNDIRYFYYALRNIDLANYGYERHFKYLKGEEIPVPSLPTQCRIASILSAYDELIENNQRRIRILEEMARSLHREWFVHFRYPGHEPVPLIDSPLGQIPQGWEAKKIAELLAKVSRQGKIKTQDYLQTGALPVVDQGRELVGGYTNDADVEYSGELPVIVFGDHTRILKFIDFPFACGADGTQLLRSNDERMPVSLFYYTLSAIELSDFAYARHFKFLKEELVVVPIAEVATAFSERIDPIKRQVRVLQQQSDNLRRTRDLLLPRLLAGQVNLGEN
jgi:type I restriction enzyme S subunit